MPPSGYQELEHTADLAIRVWAEDFPSLLIQSVQGMYHLMALEVLDETHLETDIFIGEGDQEIQLVDFLSELLYLCEDEGQAYFDFSFTESDGGWQVLAIGKLVASQESLIKAVTFHDLSIRQNEFGLETEIIFDV
jgi:SHS2 domain-containing protein